MRDEQMSQDRLLFSNFFLYQCLITSKDVRGSRPQQVFFELKSHTGNKFQVASIWVLRENKIVHLPIPDIKTQGLCGCWTWSNSSCCEIYSTKELSISEIARRTGHSRGTVRKYLLSSVPPSPPKRGKRSSAN